MAVSQGFDPFSSRLQGQNNYRHNTLQWYGCVCVLVSTDWMNYSLWSDKDDSQIRDYIFVWTVVLHPLYVSTVSQICHWLTLAIISLSCEKDATKAVTPSCEHMAEMNRLESAMWRANAQQAATEKGNISWVTDAVSQNPLGDISNLYGNLQRAKWPSNTC